MWDGRITNGDLQSEFQTNMEAITGKYEKQETVVNSLLKSLAFGASEFPPYLVVDYMREGELRLGQTVRIGALSKAKDYNGKIGIVTGPCNKRDRYPVLMWDTKKTLGLRASNLLRVLGGGDQMRARVMVIGAGAAGLAAAKFLQDRKVNVTVLEGRSRIGGRTCTLTLPERDADKLESQNIDMGASYIHNCDSSNEIFQIALREKPLAAVGAGSRWADTECARWFDDKSGEEMSALSNAKVHLLHWKIGANMTRIAKKLGPAVAPKTPISKVFEEARGSMVKQLQCNLSDQEKRMLAAIRTRMWGYVSNMDETASELVRHLPQDDVDLNTIIGSDFYNLQYSMSLDVRVQETDNPKVGHVDSKDGTGDRLLANGYGPFLVKYLSRNLRCITGKSVQRITITHLKAGARNSKRRKPQVSVRCRDGTTYTCEYLICAVPLGVLQNEHRDSCITFEPALPQIKKEAIRSLGSGAHNKIIVRFKPEHVFWPKNTPQLVPLDQRFHILNLHAYGKPGILCAHVWPPFAFDWKTKSDQEVVDAFCDVLKGMFWRLESDGKRKMRTDAFPKPVDYVVGRWDSDPFSLGSYSYLKLGATWQQIEHLAAPFPSRDPHLFFAGEATSLEGIQCVTGAYKSGERAARQILAEITNKRRGLMTK